MWSRFGPHRQERMKREEWEAGREEDGEEKSEEEKKVRQIKGEREMKREHQKGCERSRVKTEAGARFPSHACAKLEQYFRKVDKDSCEMTGVSSE